MTTDMRFEPFAIESGIEGSTVTAVLSGELDMTSVPEVEAALPPVEPGGRLVMDLRGLTFMDSSGVRVLMSLDVRARSEGWALIVVRVPGPVQRLLELCRMSDRVQLVDDPADAA
jgi:anti-sigma B factor antagonist